MVSKQNYAGSLSGSLQDKQILEPGFQKSPMLNTGKKLSNNSLTRGYNRSSAPQGGPPKFTQPHNPARTAANWMAKQPPLSLTRNPREISGRINTGGIAAGENLLASQ